MSKSISIPIEITPEIIVALNETEQELKNYFQIMISILLFQEGKLTIGKAIQLSGLSRFEFEKYLAKKNIPLADPEINQVFEDANKISD